MPEALPDPSALAPLLAGARPQLARGPDFAYLNPIDPGTLPEVPRDRYLHLIVDRSEANAAPLDLRGLADRLREAFPEIRDARLSLANFNVVELPGGPFEIEDLPGRLTSRQLESLPAVGGLDLDKALAHAIRGHTTRLDAYEEGAPPPPEPVFVVLGRAAEGIELEPELSPVWQSHLSRLELHALGRDGSLNAVLAPEAADAPLLRIGRSLRPVRTGRSLVFPASEGEPRYWDPEAAAWKPLTHDSHPADSAWSQAVAVSVANHRYAASPGSFPEGLKAIVAESRRLGVLVPATSYIVVENEAQWRMLEHKESQKLEQNEALDFLETPAPPTLWLAAALAVWLAWRRRRSVLSRLCPQAGD